MERELDLSISVSIRIVQEMDFCCENSAYCARYRRYVLMECKYHRYLSKGMLIV